MVMSGTNITMIKGDTEKLTIKIQEDSVDRPLVTGDTVYMTVKNQAIDVAKVLQKVITSFTDGAAIIDIAHSDTANIKAGTYTYDVQITFDDGRVVTVIKPSTFKIEEGVTAE